jgi:hypothetical protein
MKTYGKMYWVKPMALRKPLPYTKEAGKKKGRWLPSAPEIICYLTYLPLMASSLAILSSIGGWVLKSLIIEPPESGLTMNM